MNGVFFFLFACFWSMLILGVDRCVGRNLWNQFASGNYLSTTGQITHSEVTQHRGFKGRISYGLDIHYRYAANDRASDGMRFR